MNPSRAVTAGVGHHHPSVLTGSLGGRRRQPVSDQSGAVRQQVVRGSIQRLL